ncbi:MAG: hypothetical protein WBE41_00395 [Terracidiphilus sp.]
MAAKNNRFRPVSNRLPAGMLEICAFLALTSFAGSPTPSRAQSTPTQQAPPAPAQPATQETTPAPTQPTSDAQSSSVPAQQDANSAPTPPAAQPPTAATPAEPRAPYPGITPEDKSKQQVAQECADLLKLATDLKAQVDKATKDELSVTVVRKATELEQMAHKVRSGTALSTSNQKAP